MILIQARLTSERLPNKILLSLGNGSMLDYVLRACQGIDDHDDVCLAFPDTRNHRGLGVDIQAEHIGIHVTYGPEDDVFVRLAQAYTEMLELGAAEEKPVIRVCADRPFLQSSMLDALYDSTSPDTLTYNHDFGVESGPRGLGAEAMGQSLAHDLFRGSKIAVDREHVTLGIYRSRPDLCKANRLAGSPKWLWEIPRTFDVNTFEELLRARRLMGRLSDPQRLFLEYESWKIHG